MELQFSRRKIIGHIVSYILLFLAGDLLNSLVFDLLFSIVELPIRDLYSILRMLGCLIFTYLLFWLYTIKILRLKMESFRIALSIKKWAFLYAVVCGYLLFHNRRTDNDSFKYRGDNCSGHIFRHCSFESRCFGRDVVSWIYSKIS